MFKCIFLNENVWIPIEISLKFVVKGSINNNPALFQIMAWRRPGHKPISEPMVVSSLTHICVTWPQRVNINSCDSLTHMFSVISSVYTGMGTIVCYRAGGCEWCTWWRHQMEAFSDPVHLLGKSTGHRAFQELCTVHAMCWVLMCLVSNRFRSNLSGWHHWYWGKYTIFQVPVKQLWRVWWKDNKALLWTDGITTTKRKSRHVDEMFITGYTGSCHFDNFQCSHWLKFHQNEDISVSVHNKLERHKPCAYLTTHAAIKCHTGGWNECKFFSRFCMCVRWSL